MIDWTKPVRTQDGRPVEIKFTDGRGDQPIVGYIEGDNGVSEWCVDGTFSGVGFQSMLDLENIPEAVEPRVTWVWQFGDGSAEAFRSESKALEHIIIDGFRATLLKLTYTPGHASVEIIEERK